MKRTRSKLSLLLVLAMVFVVIPLTAATAAPATGVGISEFHYDNTGADAGEFVEVTGDAGGDLAGWTIELYNGSNSETYATIALSGVIDDEDGSQGALSFLHAGIQNGSPDGLALVDPGSVVIEFLSYEGVITAVNGSASGMTSTDVGVDEPSTTPIGESLQLVGGVWTGPTAETPGDLNEGGSPGPPDIHISEIHYDNASTDVGEFVEVTGDAGADLTGWTVELYNGNGGTSYGTIALSGVIPDEDGSQGAVAFFEAGIQNGAPDGMALVDDLGVVVEFLSYEGFFDAVGGPADGMTSVDIGVAESSSTPIGESLQLIADVWTGPSDESPGLLNAEAPPLPDATEEKIHDVQGSGLVSPFDGLLVIIEGVVTSDQQDGELNGFFMQEEDADHDADPSTSEGIFVYEGASTVEVSVGDVVEVEGLVVEFDEMTEITDVVSVAVTGAGAFTETVVTLPWADVDQPEWYEGMYVTIPQPLTISEYFNFDRYGEIVLTTERAPQPTAVFDPGSTEAADQTETNLLGRITLDDNRTSQNPDPAIHPNGAEWDLTNLFRGGDLVENVTGAVNQGFGLYRIQPTQGADYTSVNPRTVSHDDVGGTLTVASFNVLNYFTTIDTGSSICGPNEDLGCRGADSAEEFTRQRDKIVSAITDIGADIVGLIEIENHIASPSDVPLADLVSGINDVLGAGTYDYVDTGAIGDDAIKVAFIYKPATVALDGAFAVLDALVDPDFNTDKNRPALAQTFMEISSGESVTVAVNHLKSKGSSCDDVGDPDLGDGAGNCNLTRTSAAQALVDWLGADATGTGEDDVLIIGDLNSYDKEDPIDAIVSDGYLDLVADFGGELAYSYVFSGAWGYLDYALANGSLQSSVTGTTVWHINADEPDALDYNIGFKQPPQQAIYEPNAYRASDHDPVIVGLELVSPTEPDITPPEVSAALPQVARGLYLVQYSCTDAVDPNPDCVGDINGVPVDDGQFVRLIRWRNPFTISWIDGGLLHIQGPDFLLTATGTDASGNSDDASTIPGRASRE